MAKLCTHCDYKTGSVNLKNYFFLKDYNLFKDKLLCKGCFDDLLRVIVPHNQDK